LGSYTERSNVPEESKPLTREDVIRLIEENGGTVGLDLTGASMRGIDLHGDADFEVVPKNWTGS